MESKTNENADPRPAPAPYRVRLPGFLADAEIGLGDVVKHITHMAGIPACGGCQRRQEALNRRVVFSGRDR